MLQLLQWFEKQPGFALLGAATILAILSSRSRCGLPG